jgi:hypothetical protein
LSLTSRLLLVFAIVLLPLQALAATPPAGNAGPLYAPRNSFGLFAEYSNDSSHMLLGYAYNRKLGALGADYERMLAAGHALDWTYLLEVRPLMTESDPTLRGFTVSFPSAPCSSLDETVKLPHQVPIAGVGPSQNIVQCVNHKGQLLANGVITTQQGRRWTYVGGLSPIGFALHFAPRHPLQGFAIANGGFAVSPRDIPMFDTSAFNFTFQLGVGLEWYRDQGHSWRLEYRYHHLSNKEIGALNFGVDSSLFKVTYTFAQPRLPRL